MANKANRVRRNIKREQKSSEPTNYSPGVRNQDKIPASNLLIARTQQNPDRLTPTDTLQLQRTVGNRAVSLMLNRTGQQTLLQKQPEVTGYLEQMQKIVSKQQQLLEKVLSSTGAGGGQQSQQSGGSDSKNPENGAKFLAQQMTNPMKFAAAIKAGHQPGKPPPAFPPKDLKKFLKQMKFGPGIKPGSFPGRKPPPPSPQHLKHFLKQMKFGPGMKGGNPYEKDDDEKRPKHLKHLLEQMGAA